MFLRQVSMGEKFLAGERVYTRVGVDQVKDENGIVTKLPKTANVSLVPKDFGGVVKKEVDIDVDNNEDNDN